MTLTEMHSPMHVIHMYVHTIIGNDNKTTQSCIIYIYSCVCWTGSVLDVTIILVNTHVVARVTYYTDNKTTQSCI